MSPRLDDAELSGFCFPRVSGDEPHFRRLKHFFGQFSPRERG